MINPAVHADHRLSDTAKGLAVYIAEHPDGAHLGDIMERHADSYIRIAWNLDDLERAGYIRRIGDFPPGVTITNPTDWPDITYVATAALTGKDAA